MPRVTRRPGDQRRLPQEAVKLRGTETLTRVTPASQHLIRMVWLQGWALPGSGDSAPCRGRGDLSVAADAAVTQLDSACWEVQGERGLSVCGPGDPSPPVVMGASEAQEGPSPCCPVLCPCRDSECPLLSGPSAGILPPFLCSPPFSPHPFSPPQSFWCKKVPETQRVGSPAQRAEVKGDRDPTTGGLLSEAHNVLGAQGSVTSSCRVGLGPARGHPVHLRV